MAQPIIFKITNAGKLAALNASTASPKIKINLTKVAVSATKRVITGSETALTNEVKRFSIISGDVHVSSNTLRFTGSMTVDAIMPIYQVGLLTDDGVLFAIAGSNTTPLFNMHPDITFVIGFGLSLNGAAAGSVKVTTDPNGALSVVIMEQHLAAPDPHPQYINAQRFSRFLELAYPYGHPYWTHSKVNPKPLFDAMFGYETHWRRLEGVGLVAVKDGDAYIGQPMIMLGQRGMTELATSQRPQTYPIYTSYLFERYDPSTVVETIWRVIANKTSVDEGDAIRFTVTANNLPDGQILTWSAKEGVLNSASNNITPVDKSDSGTTILNNGQAIINFVTSPDENRNEPQKHVRLTVGAPANLVLNIPVNDAGHNEVSIHISQSTNNGIDLAEYYKQQSGNYPVADDKLRFIVDAGVDVIAPNTSTPAIINGSKWPTGNTPIIENRGRILGHGGNGGQSAVIFALYDYNNISKVDPAKAGDNGGVAVKGNLLIENYSLIAGGGGGGGGMGAWLHDMNDGNNFAEQALGGGGGSGGGAPYGLRSANISSIESYLDDDRFPVKFNYTGTPHAILITSTAVSTIGGTESPNDPNATKSPDADKNYLFYLPASTSGDKHKIMVNNGAQAGQSRALSCDLLMSKSATLSAGVGGSNGVGGFKSGDNEGARYITKVTYSDISGNKGGDGGGLGESGKVGSIQKYFDATGGVIDGNDAGMKKIMPSAAGGLAGLIKEGSVTITNFGSGTTKGR